MIDANIREVNRVCRQDESTERQLTWSRGMAYNGLYIL
jgi:hypothetical protein